MRKQTKKKPRKKYPEWRFPSLQKHRDNIALLIEYPEFQREIKKIRLKLEIPEEGNKTDKNIKEWTYKMYAKSDEIENDPEFIKQDQRIRKRLKNGEISVEVANKEGKILLRTIPFNYLHESINMLIKKFHLPANYYNFLHDYIISNSVHIPTSNFVIGDFTVPYYERKNLGYVPVKVYSRLSDEDLKELKIEVNKWFGKHLPKYQSLKGVNKKLEVLKWHNDRMRRDEVTGEEYKISDKEIAESLLGNKNKGSKVYDIIRTLKKLWISRFGKE